MVTSKDRVTMLILICGAYGPVLLSFLLYSKIFEFIVVGMFYAFFTATIHHTKRYEEYLTHSSKRAELYDMQSRYAKMSREGVVYTCLRLGIIVGVILFTLKMLLAALFV